MCRLTFVLRAPPFCKNVLFLFYQIPPEELKLWLVVGKRWLFFLLQKSGALIRYLSAPRCVCECLFHTHTHSYLLNNIPWQSLLFMEFWVWGWSTRGQFKPVLKWRWGAAVAHLLTSKACWPPNPPTHPFKNTKEQTQPPPSCLSPSL